MSDAAYIVDTGCSDPNCPARPLPHSHPYVVTEEMQRAAAIAPAAMSLSRELMIARSYMAELTAQSSGPLIDGISVALWRKYDTDPEFHALVRLAARREAELRERLSDGT